MKKIGVTTKTNMRSCGRLMFMWVLIVALGSCQSAGVKTGGSGDGGRATADLLVVDCLLPSQIRNLGNMRYPAPRKPIKTTAVDCRIRGGEYVAYDRANYRTALNVWLPQAQGGDAEAQNYVGEIFEKGLGQKPDYQSALKWYRKAAAQDYSRAKINLGYMYEKGLGVPKNLTRALNWYRQASGIEGDDLVLNSDAQQALKESRKELSKKLAKSKVQTRLLSQQLNQMQKKLNANSQQVKSTGSLEQGKALAEAKGELEAITELYQQAVYDRKELQEQLNSTEIAYRSYNSEKLLSPTKLEDAQAVIAGDVQFGRYFALIIGNQDYHFLEDLRSPLKDAQRIKQVLEQKYGFSAALVTDATGSSILNTLNDFYEQIGENDNLLIYYAGHGNISKSEQSRTERGYWLPVDANKENISNWINNSVISDHLDRLKARSVLVISDSCYAGYLGAENSPYLFGLSSKTESKRVIEAGLSRRARVVISSGGVKPVLDGSNKTHSIFAGSLIEVLEKNTSPMRDSTLFSQLSVNVRKRSGKIDQIQMPELKPVREAGHEGGAFYFVPI